MAEIVVFKLKETYDAALRDQDPMRKHSKGYPAVRTEIPTGPLHNITEWAEHKMRQKYGPSVQT